MGSIKLFQRGLLYSEMVFLGSQLRTLSSLRSKELDSRLSKLVSSMKMLQN